MSDDEPLFFRGAEGYKGIFQDRRLRNPGVAIRVYNYARLSGDELLYVIGTEQKLFDPKTGNEVRPEDVLSREAAPDGWSVEGLALHLLPESELEKILGLPEGSLKGK